MNEANAARTRPARASDDIAIVLLLVQSVVGLVGLLGLLVVGIVAGFPVVTLAGAVVLAGFVVPLLLSVGVARGRRWAPPATIGYESLTLLSFAVNLLLALSPDVQIDLTLTGLLTTVVLPVAVIGLTRSRQAATLPEAAAPLARRTRPAGATTRQAPVPAGGA